MATYFCNHLVQLQSDSADKCTVHTYTDTPIQSTHTHNMLKPFLFGYFRSNYFRHKRLAFFSTTPSAPLSLRQTHPTPQLNSVMAFLPCKTVNQLHIEQTQKMPDNIFQMENWIWQINIWPHIEHTNWLIPIPLLYENAKSFPMENRKGIHNTRNRIKSLSTVPP